MLVVGGSHVLEPRRADRAADPRPMPGSPSAGAAPSLRVALLIFLLIRDGRAAPGRHFRNMGPGGIGVASALPAASISFVIALQHATVALILVVQSTAPLIAGLLAWIWMRESLGWPRILAMTWSLSAASF